VPAPGSLATWENEELEQQGIDELGRPNVRPVATAGDQLRPGVRQGRDDALGDRDGDGRIGVAMDDEHRAGDLAEPPGRDGPVELGRGKS